MDQALSIGDLFGAFRRRLPMVLLIVLVGVAAASIVAMRMPASYEATTKVLVESPQISSDLARTTVTQSTATRMQMIEQRLMARDSILGLIDRLGLFADMPGLSTERKIELVRAATKIEKIQATGAGYGNDVGGVIAFTISVILGNAEKAAAAANALAESAIAQNLEVRSSRAKDTLAYFDAEEKRIAAALADAERDVSDFKRQNEGALPDDLEANRDALGRLQTADLDLDRQILDLDLRLGELRATLNGTSTTAAAGGLSPEETERSRLELDLAQKRRVLAPNHPEIRQLEQRLAAVRALTDPKAAATTGADSGTTSQRTALIREQVNQISDQVAQLRARKAALGEDRARIEAAIRRTPEVEAQLNALNRTLDDLRDRYTEAAQRRAEARTGEQLEASEQSERFEVLEPALVPDIPVGPNRKKFLVLGIGASAALAGGLVLLLEILNGSMRTTGQMERKLGIRPVVSIPYVRYPGERMARRGAWLGGVAAAAALLWFSAGMIDKYVIPLDAVQNAVAARLGFTGGAEEPQG